MASTAIAVIFSAPVIYTVAADTPLFEPHNLIVDRSLPREQADAQIIAARRFGQIQGQGQTINFIVTDIYRVAGGRIAENWHIEDNLTLQQQLGLISK